MYKYVIAFDIEEDHCRKKTRYVKMDWICCEYVDSIKDADHFTKEEAQKLWRSLEHHNCDEPYYIIEIKR
jgi:hypothetical protein